MRRALTWAAGAMLAFCWLPVVSAAYRHGGLASSVVAAILGWLIAAAFTRPDEPPDGK